MDTENTTLTNRRTLLARIGLAGAGAYIAPAFTTLSSASASSDDGSSGWSALCFR